MSPPSAHRRSAGMTVPNTSVLRAEARAAPASPATRLPRKDAATTARVTSNAARNQLATWRRSHGSGRSVTISGASGAGTGPEPKSARPRGSSAHPRTTGTGPRVRGPIAGTRSSHGSGSVQGRRAWSQCRASPSGEASRLSSPRSPVPLLAGRTGIDEGQRGAGGIPEGDGALQWLLEIGRLGR